MNVNELTANLYGNYGTEIRNIKSSIYSKKDAASEAGSVTESFSDILSSYALSEDTDDLVDRIDELKSSLDEEDKDNVDKSDVMNILTDVELAKEYLESKTGRNLIISMVENDIASIISNSGKE